jgi:tetratricopeptide (TPR) repeat protein
MGAGEAMRILLLGVGNAPVRHSTMSTFFENFARGASSDVEIVTFGFNDGVDIRIDPRDDFSAVVSHLPEGWIPDACILQGIDYNLLPRGIEKSPFPTVVFPFPGDWDMDLVYTKAIVESVDLTIGGGYFDETTLPRVGAASVRTFYLGSVLDEYIARDPRAISERPYDIFFTSTWFDDITHPARSRWLVRLVELSKTCKVLIETPKTYAAYLEALGRAKMAFSHVRRGAFSNRVLEAAARGTVPVVTGEDVTMHFRDGEEFVSVSEENFFERIHFYLTNPGLLQKISEGAHARVRRDFRSEPRFISMLEMLREFSGKPAGRRRTRELDQYDLHLRRGEVYFYAYFRTVAGGYFFTDRNALSILEEALAEFQEAARSKATPRARTSVAVAKFALLYQEKDRRLTLANADELLRCFEQIVADHPFYMNARFHHALLLYVLNRHREASDAFEAMLKVDQGGFDPWCLQNRHMHLFNRLLQLPLNEALLDLCGGKDAEAIDRVRRLYRFVALFIVSLIREELGDLFGAAEMAREAQETYAENGWCAKRLAALLAVVGEEEEAVRMYARAGELLPMDVDLRLNKVRLLYQLGRDGDVLPEIRRILDVQRTYKKVQPDLGVTKALMESLRRFSGDSPLSHDSCEEESLQEWIAWLSLCLRKHPSDSRLVRRIANLWRKQGREDRAMCVLDEYLCRAGGARPDGDDWIGRFLDAGGSPVGSGADMEGGLVRHGEGR